MAGERKVYEPEVLPPETGAQAYGNPVRPSGPMADAAASRQRTPVPTQASKPPVIPFVLAGLALLYVISPIDAVPDMIPVLGWLDDILIGAGGITAAAWGAFKLMQQHTPRPAPR